MTPRKPNMAASAAVVVAQEQMTEKDLQSSIHAAALDCGWKYYHTQVSLYSARGFPDLILCKPPHLFFWELKSSKGKPTAAQTGWIEALKQVPCVDARVVYPGDLEAAYQALVTGEWPK